MKLYGFCLDELKNITRMFLRMRGLGLGIWCIISTIKNKKIEVKGTEIIVYSKDKDDFISLTDIARFKNPNEPKDVVKNWMRTRSTIEFIGLWEKIHNPDFKGVEFDSFLYEAGSNSFVLSPSKWIEKTNAIGIISKPAMVAEHSHIKTSLSNLLRGSVPNSSSI